MNPRRRLVLVLGLVLAARESGATSPRSGMLKSELVVSDGKVLLCQPDESFTILDASTGAPLVRDTEARCQGWLRLTEHGPLLSTHWGHRMIDVAQSVARRRLVARWEIGSAKRGCRSSQVIDDHLVCARAEDFVVESRSLADNALRWSYDAPGAVMDIIPHQGRLLLQSGDYRLARHVSVVDLRSGRLLFREAVGQDASFGVRSFDGERIVLEARPPAGNACPGVVVRTLTPAGDRLVAQDACGETAPRGQPTPAPDLRKEWTGKEAALRFEDTTSGTWMEGTRDGARWWAYARRVYPTHGVHPRLQRVYEDAAVLVLERETRQVASLECLDARTGRPRWLYVYNPFRRPNQDWESAKVNPPRGTVPATAPPPPAAGRRAIETALASVPYPAPLVFDPAPMAKAEPEDWPFAPRAITSGRRSPAPSSIPPDN
jgi:hypothetical protein